MALSNTLVLEIGPGLELFRWSSVSTLATSDAREKFDDLVGIIHRSIVMHRFLKVETVQVRVAELDCGGEHVICSVVRFYEIVGWKVTVSGPVDECGYMRMVFVLELPK